MSNQFTSGTWEVEVGEDRCFHQGNRVAITVSGMDGDEPYNVTIAELWPASNDMDIKDARLIAAAPALYEALQTLDWAGRIFDKPSLGQQQFIGAFKKALEEGRAALVLVDAASGLSEVFLNPHDRDDHDATCNGMSPCDMTTEVRSNDRP